MGRCIFLLRTYFQICDILFLLIDDICPTTGTGGESIYDGKFPGGLYISIPLNHVAVCDKNLKLIILSEMQYDSFVLHILMNIATKLDSSFLLIKKKLDIFHFMVGWKN